MQDTSHVMATHSYPPTDNYQRQLTIIGKGYEGFVRQKTQQTLDKTVHEK
jgi:hypothetical protein